MKTHRSALVVIPPEELWGPIQAIRRRYDRKLRRWRMPHITVIYPFRAREEFPSCLALAAELCAGFEPFQLKLARFGWFEHAHSFTMWLDPEPAGELKRLQAELVRAFPDCNDTSLFENGFRPHLSVGQVRNREELNAVLEGLEASWKPLDFKVRELAAIWRGPETDDVFVVQARIPLGRMHT